MNDATFSSSIKMLLPWGDGYSRPPLIKTIYRYTFTFQIYRWSLKNNIKWLVGIISSYITRCIMHTLSLQNPCASRDARLSLVCSGRCHWHILVKVRLGVLDYVRVISLSSQSQERNGRYVEMWTHMPNAKIRSTYKCYNKVILLSTRFVHQIIFFFIFCSSSSSSSSSSSYS